MGVEFQVVLYADDGAHAEEVLTKAMARVAALDKALSDYDPESELSKLCETSNVAPGVPQERFPSVKVSDDLWIVLSVAQRISQESDGAFDVTIGPLSRLWRRARRWKELPEPDALTEARNRVGFQFLKLDPATRTVQLLKPNMRLDLGGIAKGYAADEAREAIKACGIRQALVRASGDISAGDPPPGQPGWQVGIAPLNADDPPQRFVELANCAISTSGDARQHLVVAGKRYSHIIDPRTGVGISGRSSVTVIAPQGIIADGLDTAASVQGPQKALAIAQKFAGAELLMVYEDESGQQTTIESPGFKRFEIARPN
jgi:thiamine biosynthesis lipoprotein